MQGIELSPRRAVAFFELGVLDKTRPRTCRIYTAILSTHLDEVSSKDTTFDATGAAVDTEKTKSKVIAGGDRHVL